MIKLINNNANRKFCFAVFFLFLPLIWLVGCTKADSEYKEIERQAKGGDITKQIKLAEMYYKGEGVTQDYTKAFEWYSKAAAQGNSDAQVNLGDMYYTGDGVAKDYTKAFEWFTKAAEQNNADAQFRIALMYSRGEGVPQDYVYALKWLYLAKSNTNDSEEMERISVYIPPLELKCTPEQIAKAQKLAAEFKPKQSGK